MLSAGFFLLKIMILFSSWKIYLQPSTIKLSVTTIVWTERLSKGLSWLYWWGPLSLLPAVEMIFLMLAVRDMSSLLTARPAHHQQSGPSRPTSHSFLSHLMSCVGSPTSQLHPPKEHKLQTNLVNGANTQHISIQRKLALPELSLNCSTCFDSTPEIQQ